MDGGAWWAAVHGVAEGRTQLSDFTFTFHFHALEKEMATYSSVLAWRIPGTEKPGGLQSMGSHRVGHESGDLAAAAAEVLSWKREDFEALCVCAQSHLTLCDPMESPTRFLCLQNFPGKNTEVGCHFLLQCMKVKSESEVAQSCLTLRDPWTAAYRAPPSMGFSRQEYWSGSPVPSPSFVIKERKRG